MAIQKDNVLMHGTSGSIGKLLTFRQCNGKTIVSRYPDMSKVVYSKAQLAERFRFKLAVAYARAIIADPSKKKIYALKKHFSAYHAAIAEYLNRSKAEETQKVAEPLKEKPEKTGRPGLQILMAQKQPGISPVPDPPSPHAPS